MQRHRRAVVVEFKGARRRVELARRRATQDPRVEIELQRKVDAGPLDLPAEEFLRKGRTVVGRVALVADDGQRAVVALLP